MELLNLGSKLAAETVYDAFIAALGFESRAVAVAESVPFEARRKFAFGFDHNQVLAHDRNLEWFRSNRFEVWPGLDATDFALAVKDLVEASAPLGPLRIAIDISCFDRQRLAVVVDACWRASLTRPVQVDFAYCIAAFRKPSSSSGRNEFAGPVHRSFAGRFIDPGRPLAMVAGLGYELGKVVGAAEYLQASRVIALFPESPVHEYEPEVTEANRLLFDDLKASDVVRYPVDDCRKTVATLDAIVRGLRDSHNVVLLPGGPKIFVLASLLAQRLHRHASVWRVSSGASITARDVQSSGHFVTASLRLGC